MTLKILTVFAFFSSLLSFNLLGKKLNPDEKFQSTLIKRIESKFHLKCTGIGGGKNDDIRYYSFNFNFFGKLSIDEARCLLLKIANECTEILDQSKDIYNLIQSTSADKNNFHIGLYCSNKDGSELDRDDFSFCGMFKGKIRYYRSGENVFDSVLFEETYEEALKLIKEKENAS